MKWMKLLFKLDEENISAVVFCMMTALLFSLLMYAIHGDITDNLVQINSWLIGAVVGTISANKLLGRRKKTNREEIE